MSKVKSLFEYLLALRHLTYEPARKISDYEKHWMIDELPIGPGLLVGGAIDNGAYIEVRQQRFEGDYPAFSPVLGRVFALLGFDYTKEKSRIVPILELKEIMAKEIAELKVIASLGKDASVELTEWKQLLTETLKTKATLGELLEKLAGAEKIGASILEEYKTWAAAWEIWAINEKAKRKVQKFYEHLFNLRQRIVAEGQPLEIIFGKGMLYGQFKEAIEHPLLTTRLELEFDPQKGIAKLKPVPHSLTLEMEMLADVALPNPMEVMKLRREIEAGAFNIFDEAEVESKLKSFVHYLHPDGQFSKVGKPLVAPKKPMVTPEASLVIREKSTVKLTADLKNTIDYLNRGGDVPETVKAIVGDAVIERKGGWDEQLLFPMPANGSQKEIARLIGQYAAVTVQGPPGTGKSHTIANLAAHLVAHGYRVLVTSEKDKALKVLMNKLPEEVRDLAVSMLGNQAESLGQMQASVAQIIKGMSSLDEKTLGQEIQTLNRSLDMVKRQIHLAEQNLIRFRELDAKGTLWKDRMAQPYELAQLAAVDKERFSFLKDAIEMDAVPTFSNEEFSRLWELRGKLTLSDLEAGAYRFPDVRIMSAADFSRMLSEKKKYEEALQALQGDHAFALPTSREAIFSLDKRIQKVAQMVDGLAERLEQQVLEDCLLDPERQLIWKVVFDQLQGIIVDINAHELKSLNYEVDCPFYGHDQYEEMMRAIRQRLEAGKKLSGMYFLFNGPLKAFYENTRVNGQKISTLDDLQQIKWHQEKNNLLEEFSKTWNRHFVPLGAAILDPYHGQVLFNYHSKLKQLGRILEVSHQFNELQDGLKEIDRSNQLEFSQLGLLQDVMSEAKNRQKLESWKEVYQQVLRQYKGPLLGQNVHPICKELFEVLVACDEGKFPLVRQRLDELLFVAKEAKEFLETLERLRAGLPELAGQMKEWVGQEMEIPGTFSDLFDYGKLKTFLEKIESWNPDDLELKLKLMEEEQGKLICKLIKKMAWKHQLARIEPEEERALLSWLQKIQRHEPTSQKAIEALRQQSKLELQACHRAIPIWVMPVKEVLETFPASPDLFDVIIVDEASQCSVTSLPILMRANKAVIVGDDQQISPILPGISDAQVQELQGRYLHDFAKTEAFDLQTSLYDVAARSYSSKGKLMLKEHFRCVPEIIAFSNALSYQNQMIPLKLPMESEKSINPVEAIYVEGASRDKKKTNEMEASKLVADLVALTKDKRFDGKTFGVISLLGAEQAKLIQKMLVEAIGEQEIMERELLCGDAYSFQGDERDVMFLSLVVAPNARYATLNKKMYTQRFNVAASRAKSVMRLYHSVTLDELQPEDVRHRLLAYCQNPAQKGALPSGNVETILEKDVYEAIRQAGYGVKPKVQVGNYQIDLVIEGNRQCLAIECTGDSFYGGEQIEQDMNRQRVLERAGWKFQKIRASHFYLNKELALAPIWSALEELGIEKAGA